MSRLRLLLIAADYNLRECQAAYSEQVTALRENANFEVLRACQSWVEVAPDVQELKPDVIVVLGSPAKASQPAGADHIPQQLTEFRCVIVTSADRVAQLQATLQPEIHRVLPITAPLRDLCNAICDVADDGLSARERDVLRMLARGYTNKEIAARLELSVKSVEKYKTRSHEKLGLRSRANAVSYAISRGWLVE